jgi:hypothetical protein
MSHLWSHDLCLRLSLEGRLRGGSGPSCQQKRRPRRAMTGSRGPYSMTSSVRLQSRSACLKRARFRHKVVWQITAIVGTPERLIDSGIGAIIQ